MKVGMTPTGTGSNVIPSCIFWAGLFGLFVRPSPPYGGVRGVHRPSISVARWAVWSLKLVDAQFHNATPTLLALSLSGSADAASPAAVDRSPSAENRAKRSRRARFDPMQKPIR